MKLYFIVGYENGEEVYRTHGYPYYGEARKEQARLKEIDGNWVKYIIEESEV
mgnify:CR=1 FL=1